MLLTFLYANFSLWLLPLLVEPERVGSAAPLGPLAAPTPPVSLPVPVPVPQPVPVPLPVPVPVPVPATGTQENPPCDICNGRPLLNPNEPIDTSLLPPDLISQIPAGITLTCGLVDQAADSGVVPAAECALIQGGIDLFCQCGGSTPG